MGILAYGDIYELCEELQQLVGTSLQEAASLNLTRHGLGFRLPGITKILVLDLTPSQPFFLSTDSTKLKIKNRPTPISNFLRAHFISAKLTKIEVAQKPNRTIRLTFHDGIEWPTLEFKCFPHGQQLTLLAKGKAITSPRREKKEIESYAFVEPESVNSWVLNDNLFKDKFFEQPSKPKIEQSKTLKLEKALENFDKVQKEKATQNEELINDLKAKAHEMGLKEKINGLEFNSIYDKIKKLKGGVLSTKQRRNELVSKIERIKSQVDESIENESKIQKVKIFSGTRTILDPQWELWVGRNANQNDELIRRAGSDDIWIHLRDYAGAHGILKGPRKKIPPDELLQRACCIVAQLSQNKKKPFSPGEHLDFIVVPRKYVKKPKGAMPGRVTVEREKVRRVVFKVVNFEVS